MTVDSELTRDRLLRFGARLCSLAAMFVGLLALVGWAFSVETLKSVKPGLVAMNPATALAVLFAGAALQLRLRPASEKRAEFAATGCAATAGVLALTSLLGNLPGVVWGVDRLLFRGVLGDNRMAPNTAVQLLLIAWALLTLDARWRGGAGLARFAAIAVAAGSLVALIGYLFDATPFYGVGSYIPMALNTAAALELLALGILCARPDRAPIALISSHGAGGMVVRRLLPVAVAVPLVLGWLRLQGEQAGLFGPAFGVALYTALNIVVLLGAIWITGQGQDRLDAERRAGQLALRRFNEELEIRVTERTAELAEANRELEQKNRENETFVYSVSHDLRSPLVNLQGFSKELGLVCTDLREILCQAALPESVRTRGLALVDDEMGESIRFIQSAVMRLSHIIDALLRLSRAGRLEYRLQQVELHDVVQRIVESMSVTISDRGAWVEFGVLPPAWGDATALEQVFANLIGNALNYLDPTRPGHVEIGCQNAAEQNGVSGCESRVYYVRDNGRGIPSAHQAKVFQAFQRLHPDAAPGEGMGLAIVRRIVERHGGRIWMESVEDVGTTFFVELPVRPKRGVWPREQNAAGEQQERKGQDEQFLIGDRARRR